MAGTVVNMVVKSAAGVKAGAAGDIVAVITPAKVGTYKDPSTKAGKDAGNATVAYQREDGIVVGDTAYTVVVTVWRRRKPGDVMV